MTAEPRPGSGTPDADDGHTINVGPVTVADPGGGTPDPTPNGQTWVCRNGRPTARCVEDCPVAAGCGPVPPAPSSDTPSDERLCGHCAASNDPSPAHRYIVGRVARQCPGRPAPSPVPEASGRGEVVQPTMHILRRADGEEMGEFAFWATDGPDGWDMAEDTDPDEDTVYEILACYPVARRKILRSTLCETCDGEGDGCPACAGSGECEPPDAEHMPIIARPAPSSSPVGDRVPPVHLLLDIWQALGGDSEAFHPWWAADPSFPDRWAQIVAAVAGNISDLAADSNPPAGALLDIAIQFAAADREEPTS